MNHSDPDVAACLPVSMPPNAVSQPWTSQQSLWQCRPTDPLRVTIVTLFRARADQPRSSQMQRSNPV